MTSPIKPPGSPSGLPSAARSHDAAKPGAFDEALSAREASAPAETTPASPTDALMGALSRGELTGAEAVEQLVAAALASPDAQLLTDAGRQELEAHLRTQLATDPSLAALVDDLER